MASFFLTGVLCGLGGWSARVCVSLGVPRSPSIVFGWFASAAVWHGLSCRVGACGGLLEISGMKVWGCICFCWPVFSGS